MQIQNGSPHPVRASSGHHGVGRYQPIFAGVAASFILGIAAAVAHFLDMDLAQIVLQLGAIVTLVGGATWARNRVVSVNTFDRERALAEQAARDEIQRVERVDAERMARRENEVRHETARQISDYLEADLAARHNAWMNEEEANEPIAGEFGFDDRGQLPQLGE